MSERISQVVFMAGQVIHQGTGKPPIGRVSVTALEGPLLSRFLEDGRLALSGDLARLMPRPHPAPYDFHLTLQVDSPQFRSGRLILQRTVSIPSNLDFAPSPPTVPAPPHNLGVILLPAEPVNIRGRVVDARNPTNILSTAVVAVTSPLGTTSVTATGGEYRLDNLVVQAPATISCTLSPTFKPITRILQLDYRLPVNEERFQMLPV